MNSSLATVQKSKGLPSVRDEVGRHTGARADVRFGTFRQCHFRPFTNRRHPVWVSVPSDRNYSSPSIQDGTADRLRETRKSVLVRSRCKSRVSESAGTGTTYRGFSGHSITRRDCRRRRDSNSFDSATSSSHGHTERYCCVARTQEISTRSFERSRCCFLKLCREHFVFFLFAAPRPSSIESCSGPWNKRLCLREVSDVYVEIARTSNKSTLITYTSIPIIFRGIKSFAKPRISSTLSSKRFSRDRGDLRRTTCYSVFVVDLKRIYLPKKLRVIRFISARETQYFYTIV